MLFNTTVFLVFFLAFYSLYWFFPFGHRARVLFLFVASTLFYATFSYRFLPFLLGTGLIDYWVASQLARTDLPEPRRKTLLVGSLVMNLGVLAYFKYANFFLAGAGQAFAWLGWKGTMPVLDIVLPVGISFYTFQSMSYVLDVYRRELAPRKQLSEFLASLTFFPHLVAGPIVRASNFLPQLQATPALTTAAAIEGGLLIAGGLAKKTIADLMAPMVEHVFSSPASSLGALDAWTGVLAFAGQIYGDFSGYTDIALGLALLIGFTLPTNFNLPYLAGSPVEFWSRWHISLSSWLRDYLYLPLRSRLRRRAYLCLILTWLLGGMWHGANWTFLVWGLYQGLLLVGTHELKARLPVDGSSLASTRAVRILCVFLTFYSTCIGWVLFRSPTVRAAFAMLKSLHLPTTASTFSYAACLALGMSITAVVACHALDLALRSVSKQASVGVACAIALACLLFTIGYGQGGVSFIYFQF